LSGWVYRKRNLGGLVFIDLRDRYGITQVVFDPSKKPSLNDIFDTIKSEFVIKVEGIVSARPESQINKNFESGEIEVLVENVEILSESKVLPFEIDQEKNISEELRLKYRYLDLRKDKLRNNLILRSNVIKYVRDLFDKEGFLEIETPILIKGTPEGSREYIVPSRLYPGNFYVLPQSPQQLKQLLMVSGFDKYFQMARCFRDEDQRGDRQPEFTQMDLEMSFVEPEDVMKVNEEILIKVVEKFAPDKKILSKPFPVLTFHDAMNRYGSDKPDIRFDMELIELSDIASRSDFNVFKEIVANKGVVKGLKVEGGSIFTRKEISEFEEVAKNHGAKGLSYIIFEDSEIKGSASKYFNEKLISVLKTEFGLKSGDILFLGAGEFESCCNFMGQVRLFAANKLGIIDNNIFAFLWVTDFPMFEKDENTGTLAARHHPFTSPKNDEDLEKDPLAALAKAYDVILNGSEIGGGSVRIHNSNTQKKVFDLLGLTEEDTQRRFGHLLEAFSYGVPPHGGIAWGIDRLIMILANEPNIREVIAFPKDQKARDLMLGSPTPIPEAQLNEANIQVYVDKK
jgi:aspartyl-tRNA synthetase